MTADPGRDKPLLTPRAALIFVTSLVAALLIGALTYAARHSMPEAAIAGCGAFVTAAVFLNRVIELPVSPASLAAPTACSSVPFVHELPLVRGHHDHVDLDRAAVAFTGNPLDVVDALLGIQPEKRGLVVSSQPEPDLLCEPRGHVFR